MKLLSRMIHCGGADGCGAVFAFVEGETTEDAAVVLRDHRASQEHADALRAEREVREFLKSCGVTA